MKHLHLWIFVTLYCLMSSAPCMAKMITLRLGPGSAGNGGTNPLGIPPGPTDIDITYVTDSEWEGCFSIVPGILFGKRATLESGLYMAAGGGLIINVNGVGIGPYAGFGIDLGETFKFNMEVKQALGLTGRGVISPYAFRIGAGYEF